MAERMLTLRELNRATLARQFLLERTTQSHLDVITSLIAMQAQVANASYIGLWARLHSFQRESLTQLLESRQLVRGSSLRGTLHLMTAEDYILVHPLIQSALSRNLPLFIKRAQGFDLERFTDMMQAYVREQPRTGLELRMKMEEFYPGMGTQQLADAIRIHMALIQPIPAGTWGFTGRPAHTEAASWLGRSIVGSEGDMQRLVLRYLAAFGPASVQDMQTWSALTRLQPIFDSLRPELLTFRDEQGRELFDLPDAPRPHADTSAPARFLPDFDNLLFSHADRRRVISDEHRSSIYIGNSRCTAFLIDGFVRGRWRLERRTASTALVIEPVREPLLPSEQEALYSEGASLMRWILDGVEAFDIQFGSVVG
ncbi:hypothetical protein KSD_68580 [Ktedonobacter sp. SOSP1-85]|uniref:winged helix DNA-binding domain-containing protein n=1 Tax=Ktedonobacter sp. SOSP1-85 TaxID=2778367 RepID=UPI0019156057|nr:winged helix DNA-binding domain-containing protein [Ktedonobacter sp. SOSP1-85]GHO79087.1 hypothetical protein KSD_68580 [Ktedonobacter sp. SOSP1-85]